VQFLAFLLWGTHLAAIVDAAVCKHRTGSALSRDGEGMVANVPGADEERAEPASSLRYRLMARELESLRSAGAISDLRLERVSPEDRAMLEVVLIDALTKWPRSDQHLLRSTLIKQGYDEQCARRLMREAISERVRASTLLSLLRPQSRPTGELDPHFLRTNTGSLVKSE
jgi:hypothetical protein